MNKKYYMQRVEPVIVHKIPFGKTGLYESIVEYPETFEDYPYDLKYKFITKELKIVNNSSIGLKINPVICEAFIHKNFKSPYLNIAEHVTIQNGIIILFFNEAKGDLTKIEKSNFTYKKLCLLFLVKAIVHLHLHRIIHGDIKCANILVYDSITKLSDFGHSALLIGNSNQSFSQKMYTPTHRAPEVWYDNEWGLSADIWALGCTLFEIVYGFSLFQIKKTENEYLRQMEAWCDNNIDKNMIFEFPLSWNDPKYTMINEIILKCLNPIANERPTIFEIIKSPFFEQNTNTHNFPINTESTYTTCFYNSLSLCPIITQRVYNEKSFENNQIYLNVYKRLNLLETDNEIKMLVMCMYETYNDTFSDRTNELINVFLIIIHLLVHRNTPMILSITNNEIDLLMRYSIQIGFSYINWNRFYAIVNKFIY